MSSARNGLTHAERAAAGATPGDRDRSRYEVAPVAESRADRRTEISTVEHMLGLLTYAAAIDGRSRGRLEAEAWLDTLRGQQFDLVRAAIAEHYKRSRFAIMPADIINLIEEGEV